MFCYHIRGVLLQLSKRDKLVTMNIIMNLNSIKEESNTHSFQLLDVGTFSKMKLKEHLK